MIGAPHLLPGSIHRHVIGMGQRRSACSPSNKSVPLCLVICGVHHSQRIAVCLPQCKRAYKWSAPNIKIIDVHVPLLLFLDKASYQPVLVCVMFSKISLSQGYGCRTAVICILSYWPCFTSRSPSSPGITNSPVHNDTKS